jgi:DNA polymerase
MDIITVDYESFWSSEYTLSKMSPLAYVMGDQYETISCSIKVNAGPTEVYFGHDDVAAAFAELDVPNSAMLAHNNSGFDAYISAYRFGLRPRMWLCTAAMARPKHAKTIGVSLAKLVQHYGIGVKDNTILMSTKGKRLADFTPAEIEAMRVYNKADTDQCYALFKVLSQGFSPKELWQIDTITRMRTEPQFELDTGLLNTALSIERSNKHKHMLELAKMLRSSATEAQVFADVDARMTGGEVQLPWGDEEAMIEFVREQLASAPKFTKLLNARGVPVPTKPSPSDPDSDKRVPALAKTDDEFIALQEHDDPIVAAAAAARLSIKSTLLETRIEKFTEAASMAGGMLPMPIKYCGADTTWRDSGEEYNPLNMPRVNKKKPKTADALRNSLRAPKGKLVIVADSSNIELRVNHTLWKVPYSTKLWAEKPDADLYRADAALQYKISMDDVTDTQRQMTKVKQLGLGFGSGADTFRRVAKQMAGLDLTPVIRYLTDAEINAGLPCLVDDEGYGYVIECDPAQEAVDDWRGRHQQIVKGWKNCDIALQSIEAGREVQVDPWGLVWTCAEGFVLNTGRNHIIRYPKLRREIDKYTKKEQWVYAEGRYQARIYGPKCDENIVQALARDKIMDDSLEYFKRTGLRPALRPYDELVYIVDEAKAQDFLDELQAVMRKRLSWWPELVMWSEGGIGPTYGSAK